MTKPNKGRSLSISLSSSKMKRRLGSHGPKPNKYEKAHFSNRKGMDGINTKGKRVSSKGYSSVRMLKQNIKLGNRFTRKKTFKHRPVSSRNPSLSIRAGVMDNLRSVNLDSVRTPQKSTFDPFSSSSMMFKPLKMKLPNFQPLISNYFNISKEKVSLPMIDLSKYIDAPNSQYYDLLSPKMKSKNLMIQSCMNGTKNYSTPKSTRKREFGLKSLIAKKRPLVRMNTMRQLMINPRKVLMLREKILWKSSVWPNVREQIVIGECLGEGNFSKVYEAYDKLRRETVAVKVFKKTAIIRNQQRRRLVEQELSIFKELRHTNVCQFYRLAEDKKRVYFVMEHCGYTTLQLYKKLKKNVPIKEAKIIFLGIMEAIKYLHNTGYCHRDIKLSNVMINPEKLKVKVIDFGLAATTSHRLSLACGTENYASPEILNNEKYLGHVSDVWSLGVLLYKLVTGKYPFGDSSHEDFKKRVASVDVYLPKEFGNDFLDLFCRIFDVNPQNRINLKEMTIHNWCLSV